MVVCLAIKFFTSPASSNTSFIEKDYLPDSRQSFRAVIVSSNEIFLWNTGQSEYRNCYHKRKVPEGKQDHYLGNPLGISPHSCLSML